MLADEEDPRFMQYWHFGYGSLIIDALKDGW